MSVNYRANALSRSALLLGVSAGALIFANPVLAQDVPPPADDQAEAPQLQVNEPAPDVSENGDTIVVTGTRIKQKEFTSPDPVTTIDPATAQRAGVNDTAEMLQSSPIAAGSTQITAAISSNFVTNGGPGAETIDLRGLGANRTLVLLNGRRAGPAGTRGGVSSFDLNVLPQSIVKQVDILKTGASSIYGSDAIAGVVNLITKTDTNGLQLDGNISAPFHSGGEQYRIGALWGKTFDRGHIMVALDYYRQNELARGDRSYLGCPAAYVFKQGTNQRADLIDPRTGKYHCEDLPVGQVWTYDYEYNYLGAPGNLFLRDGRYVGPVNLMQFQYPGENLGLPTIDPTAGTFTHFIAPPGWFPTGYDPASYAVQNDFNPYAAEATIIPKTERYTIYADAAYKLTDGIEAYGEFLANRRKTYQNGYRQFWTFGFTGDIYNDGSYGTFWAPGWQGLDFLSPTAVTNRGSDTKQQVDYWRGVGGLRGDLGGFLKGWSYDAYVQYSHNKGLYSTEQIMQDVIDFSSFQTSSCVGTTLPFSHKQCIDLPWTDPNFLMGQFTPEQAAFLFDWETGKTIYKQLSGEASMTGNLFDLPAGPVGVALGVTARRDAINDHPGDITYMVNPYYDPTLTPGSSACRTNYYPCLPTHSNAWGNTASGITTGHTVTTEAFGEIQIPLLKDRPLFRDLSFSGAARITNVKAVQGDTGITDSDNGNWTYKLGGNWAVNPWLRFRGTYGTSFRAPALFEEFKANETSFISARTIDPCVNYTFHLAQGDIDQRIATNCASQGIPGNYGGGSISATVVSQGGIGNLNPETSTAKTASIILTPRFGFLPQTRLSLAVDYFDIIVKGEISQLGAQNILFQCYDSPTFPTDPLCGLFDRGTNGTDPNAVGTVHDKYINIAKQQNRGLDFTALIQQNLGGLGSLTLLGNVTYQLKDTFALFVNTEQSNNGDIGDPKFVGDFNLTWRPRGGWTFFWGTEVYGKASNNGKFKDRHGGSLCQTSIIWGNYCVDVSVPTTFYHAASVTKEFGGPKSRLEITLGVRNMFDTRPPLVSTIGGGGLPSEIGPVVVTSQYDFIGRRVFFNLSKKF